MTPDAERILRALVDEAAARSYGDEAVGELTHALQTAYLASEAGARDELILAAALHDVGRLRAAGARKRARPHEYAGAAFVRATVSAPAARVVASHVDAKRYLVYADPEYRAKLSPASIRSLAVQGGAFDERAAAAFERLPWAGDAVALRRWDDAAKVPGAPQLCVEELAGIFTRFHARS